jgi:hypothetical protein
MSLAVLNSLFTPLLFLIQTFGKPREVIIRTQREEEKRNVSGLSHLLNALMTWTPTRREEFVIGPRDAARTIIGGSWGLPIVTKQVAKTKTLPVMHGLEWALKH